MERIEITNKSVAKVYVYTGEYEINTFHVVAKLPDSICNVLMSYFAIHLSILHLDLGILVLITWRLFLFMKVMWLC